MHSMRNVCVYQLPTHTTTTTRERGRDLMAKLLRLCLGLVLCVTVLADEEDVIAASESPQVGGWRWCPNDQTSTPRQQHVVLAFSSINHYVTCTAL